MTTKTPRETYRQALRDLNKAAYAALVASLECRDLSKTNHDWFRALARDTDNFVDGIKRPGS